MSPFEKNKKYLEVQLFISTFIKFKLIERVIG